MDTEPTWQRQLLVGLGVLLIIGVLLGGIFAAIAVKAADYVGLGHDRASNSSPNPILPTTGDATKTAPPPTTSSPPPSKRTPSTRTHKPPRQHAITLQASPPSVPSFGKISLTGTYPGHDGATLQVQRALGDGPWADFPIDTSVSASAYGTYIQTSMVGVNHIRMLDKATGTTSNVVTVQVG